MEKEEQEKVEEESDLEEDVEESEEEINQEVNDEKFVEFLAPSSGDSSIALGQIAVSTELRATDLERDLSEAPINNGGSENKEEFKYNIGSSSGEEAKYISSGNEIEMTNSPSNVDLMSLGKEQRLMPNEIGFSSSPSTKAGTLDEPGKYELPDKFDIDKAGKDNLFDKQDVKYTPSKEY